MFVVICDELDKAIGPFPTQEEARAWAIEHLHDLDVVWHTNPLENPKEAATSLAEVTE